MCIIKYLQKYKSFLCALLNIIKLLYLQKIHICAFIPISQAKIVIKKKVFSFIEILIRIVNTLHHFLFPIIQIIIPNVIII